jgi:hypothetical protein
MKVKHYFKIGQYAYRGDNPEFLLDTNQKEWNQYHPCGMPPNQNWKPVVYNSENLKNQLLKLPVQKLGLRKLSTS